MNRSKIQYQVDPFFRRAEVVSAHTKWLLCTNAFEASKDQCTPQTFAIPGYFFETGRELKSPLAVNATCDKITDSNIYTVTGCKVRRGLTMVLPVVNSYAWGSTCDANNKNCVLDDPRLAPTQMNPIAETLHIITAKLDNVTIDPFDSPKMYLNDGDMTFKANMSPTKCPKRRTDYDTANGYPVGAVGPYVFINTRKMTKGKHELLLIGGPDDSNFCSAVKHVFQIV